MDYFLALRQRAQIQRKFNARLNDGEVLLVRTSVQPALPIELVDADPEIGWLYNRNTGIGNLLDLSALSVPCGLTISGLPVGAMFYAKRFREDLVVKVGHAYERASDWSSLQPDLSWID